MSLYVYKYICVYVCVCVFVCMLLQKYEVYILLWTLFLFCGYVHFILETPPVYKDALLLFKNFQLFHNNNVV